MFLEFIFKIFPTQLKYSIYRKFFKIPKNVPKNLVFKIAETTEELEAAFKLLHDSYVEVGLMKPDVSGMRVTPYHALPSSTTLIGKMDDEVVATVTIVRDGPMGLPCDNFVDLDHLRRGGDRIAEISALAIKRGHRGKLLFHLLKFMYESCVNYLGVNHLIATLTADSKSYELYESILFFKPIDCRTETNYAFANFRPVIAEHLNLQEAFDLFKEKYSGNKLERDLFHFFTKESFTFNLFPKRQYHMINYPVMNTENFKYFLVDKTSALENMTAKQLDALNVIFQGRPQIELIRKAQASHNMTSLDKFERKNRFDVSNKTVAITNGSFLTVRLLNASREGLCISCEEPINDLLEIFVIDHFGKTAHLKAQVKWKDDRGVFGLSILEADDSWHQMINFFEEEIIAKEGSTAFKKAA